MQPSAHALPSTHPVVEEQAARPDLTGIHVLVVDDEADVRSLLQRVLQDQGATVTTAESGQEALRILATLTPDVLISDIGMSEMDGFQLLRQIRAAEPLGQRLPALALTAYARVDDRKKALLAGYQSHLAKPVDMAELVIVVAGLARSQARPT